MFKIGVPYQALKSKMEAEGLDPKGLEVLKIEIFCKNCRNMLISVGDRVKLEYMVDKYFSTCIII